MALSDLAIKKAKPSDKPVKMADSGGLYLLVTPSGSKLWRYDYAFADKRKTLAIGTYPEISLADARARHFDARKLLAHDIDPMVARREEKARIIMEANTTFGSVADEWLARAKVQGRADATIEKNRWLLENLAAPIRSIPIRQITSLDVLKLLQKVEASGRASSAHKLRGVIGTVFRFAMATVRADSDPTYALKGALIPVREKSRAAIVDPKRLGVLLRAVDASEGWASISAAIQFTLLTAARPGEVRGATWGEIDIEGEVWRIPAARMKMRRDHEVPLSFAAIRVLQKMRPLSGMWGDERIVFPSIRQLTRPLSNAAMNVRMRTLGFGKDEVTSHGFRASFSTIANESGLWSRDAIERQLAHVEDNEVRRAYNRSLHWEERVRMMEWWAREMERYQSQG